MSKFTDIATTVGVTAASPFMLSGISDAQIADTFGGGTDLGASAIQVVRDGGDALSAHGGRDGYDLDEVEPPVTTSLDIDPGEDLGA